MANSITEMNIGSANLGLSELRLTESNTGQEAVASYQPGDNDKVLREMSRG